MSDKFSLYSVMRGTSSVTYHAMRDALTNVKHIDQCLIDALLKPSPTGCIKNLEQSFYDVFKRQLTVRSKRVHDVVEFAHDVSVHFASEGNLSEQVLSFRLPFDESGLPQTEFAVVDMNHEIADEIKRAITDASHKINSTVLQDFWLSAHIRAGARKLRIAPNLVWCITEDSQQVNAEILSVFKELKIWAGRLDQPIVGAFELFALAEEKLSNARKRLSEKKRTRQSTIHQERIELGELANTLGQIKGMLGEFGDELDGMINDAVNAWDALDSASNSTPKPTPKPTPVPKPTPKPVPTLHIYKLTQKGIELMDAHRRNKELYQILAPFLVDGSDGSHIDADKKEQLLNDLYIGNYIK